MRFPNRVIQEYYYILKSMFSKMSYAEIRFLKEFKTSIIEYGLAHPNCTYEELTERFGTPQDVLCEYFDMQDATEVSQRLQKTRVKRLIFRLIGICIIIVLLVYWTLAFSIKIQLISRVPDKMVVSIIEEK